MTRCEIYIADDIVANFPTYKCNPLTVMEVILFTLLNKTRLKRLSRLIMDVRAF